MGLAITMIVAVISVIPYVLFTEGDWGWDLTGKLKCKSFFLFIFVKFLVVHSLFWMPCFCEDCPLRLAPYDPINSPFFANGVGSLFYCFLAWCLPSWLFCSECFFIPTELIPTREDKSNTRWCVLVGFFVLLYLFASTIFVYGLPYAITAIVITALFTPICMNNPVGFFLGITYLFFMMLWSFVCYIYAFMRLFHYIFIH